MDSDLMNGEQSVFRIEEILRKDDFYEEFGLKQLREQRNEDFQRVLSGSNIVKGAGKEAAK